MSALAAPIIRKQKEFAYVVLPPGHGKSYLHRQIPGVYEADSLVNCRATPKLSELRANAKLSGKWDEYDKEWVEELKAVLPEDLLVIMVPDHSIGKLLTHNFIFAGVLDHKAWAKNLEHRKGSVEEYRTWWQNVYDSGAEKFESNQDSEAALKSSISKFTDSQSL